MVNDQKSKVGYGLGIFLSEKIQNGRHRYLRMTTILISAEGDY